MGNVLSQPEQRHTDKDMPKHREDHNRNPPTSGRRDEDKPNVGKRVGRPRMEESDARVKELKANLDTLSHESEARIQYLEKTLQQATAYIKEQEARSNMQLREANATICRLQEHLAAAEDRNRYLEGILVSKQDSALDRMAADKGYTPMEDQTVRDELAKLGEKIRNWARKHSVASLEDCARITASDKELIVKELKGYTSQEGWGELVGSIPFSSAKVPALLVQALLMKSIFGRLFQHPFFAFGKIEGQESLPEPDEMMAVYRLMLQVNDSEGHTWRSQTLRGLTNPSFRQERIGAMSTKLAADFISGLAGGLLRHDRVAEAAASQNRELQGLYNGAAQLALLLWKQRSLIFCQSQEDVPVFDVNNPVMRAHRLHRLDEDDRKLDGKEILLVVQPAVLAFGSENAEHYDQYKVWAPAVVVVGGREI